jgi:type IV fimbrial biogenesis protein FimT
MHRHGHGTDIHRDPGFTVLELLVTLTIAAILLGAGAPALQQFSQRQQMKAAVGSLHNDLLLARSEAVYRNLETVACPGDPDRGCSGASDWSRGWIVFADASGDRQRQADEPLLRHGQWFERMRITSSASRSSIRFYPDGSAPASNAGIAFCGGGGPAQARRLVVSNVGRIRREDYPEINPADCPVSYP